MEFVYRNRTVCFPDVGEMYTRHFEAAEFYEQEFLEHIASLALRGTYLDLGCNIGNHLIYFSLFTAADRVVGFEPIPTFVKLIQRAIEMNGIAAKASVLAHAASDRAGPFDLTFNRRHYAVTAARVDDFAFPRVSLIKADVEGMEPQALRGSLNTIERDRPVIFAEAATPEQRDAIAAVLDEVGYAPTGLVFNATPTYEFRPREAVRVGF